MAEFHEPKPAFLPELPPDPNGSWAPMPSSLENPALHGLANALLILAGRDKVRKVRARKAKLRTVGVSLVVSSCVVLAFFAHRVITERQMLVLTTEVCALSRSVGVDADVPDHCGEGRDAVLGGASSRGVIALRAQFDSSPRPEDPDWMRARVTLAWVAKDASEVVRLLEAHPRVIAEAPSLSLDLAIAYEKLGRRDDARRAVQSGLTLLPQDPTLHSLQQDLTPNPE